MAVSKPALVVALVVLIGATVACFAGGAMLFLTPGRDAEGDAIAAPPPPPGAAPSSEGAGGGDPGALMREDE